MLSRISLLALFLSFSLRSALFRYPRPCLRTQRTQHAHRTPLIYALPETLPFPKQDDKFEIDTNINLILVSECVTLGSMPSETDHDRHHTNGGYLRALLALYLKNTTTRFEVNQ